MPIKYPGGYQIIDLGGHDFLDQTAVEIPGIYSIVSQAVAHGKIVLLNNCSVSSICTPFRIIERAEDNSFYSEKIEVRAGSIYILLVDVDDTVTCMEQ